MASLAYRLTVFAPPSVDATETTVLTPPTTAADGTARAHSDPCRVATVPLAGYQPYLGVPTIRHGKINPMTGGVDIGYASVPVYDLKVGSDNAARWWSAFLGDAQGRSAALGCRAVLEESTDGGATWVSLFVGRLQSRSLSAVLTYGLELRESSERLKARAFVGRPASSVTYAAHGRVWPPGPDQRYGTIPPVHRLMATVTGSGPWTLTNVQFVPDRNIITTALVDAAGQPVAFSTPANTTSIFTIDTAQTVPAKAWRLRARSDSGREYGVARVDCARIQGLWRVTGMVLNTLPVGTLGYTASAPDAGGWALYAQPWTAPTESVPLVLSDVHPVVLWRDLLLGRFGVLNDDGTVPAARAVAINTAAFTAAEAWPLYPARAVITESAEIGPWIEEHILKPYRLSYHVNGAGEIVPVRLSRLTSVAGLPTIADADVLTPPSWEESADGALERIDAAVVQDAFDGGTTSGSLLDTSGARLRSETVPLVSDLDARATDVTAEVLTVAPQTWRITDGEDIDGVMGAARQALNDLRALTGTGLRTATLSTNRNVTVRPGQWALLAPTQQPNAQSNRRGGTLLALCVGRTDEPMSRQVTFVDAGASTAAAAPTLATITEGTDALSVTVTRNAASDDVELWYAVTPTSVGTAPGEDDARWRLWGTVTANGVAFCAPRPANGRVWVRGRSVQSRGTLVRQRPSAFVAPSPAFLDVTVLGTVSSLSATEDGTTETYDLTWTNTDTTYLVEVLVETGGFIVAGTRLSVGTTSYRWYHVSDPRSPVGVLFNGTAYTFRVRLAHADLGAGFIETSVNVTTGTATPPAAPTLTASITDASPGGNMAQAAITYTATGGALTVTQNGSVVTPGSSPWTVSRPTDPAAPDIYVFTVTPPSAAPAVTRTVEVHSQFMFLGQPAGGGGVSKTRRYAGCGWQATDVSRDPSWFEGWVQTEAVAAATTYDMVFPLIVPEDAVITDWTVEHVRSTAFATVVFQLVRLTSGAVVTAVGGSVTSASTAGVWTAASPAAFSETASAGRAYALRCRITPDATTTDFISCASVALTFTIPTLSTGLG